MFFVSSMVWASSNLMINSSWIKYHDGMSVVHLGDSHVAGKSFPNAVKKTLKNNNYHVVAKNGVTIDYFLNNSVYNKVKSYRPGLIILSVGTNESYGRFNMKQYKNKLDRFFKKYNNITYNILITTPAGNYKNGRVNNVVNYVMATQTVYGSLHGYPVWNLYGYKGVKWWKSHGYMAHDGVHFTAKGYTIHGKQLGKDILTR